jgi:hypothetical protein
MVLDGDNDKIQPLNLCLCTPALLSDTQSLCPKHSEEMSIIHAKLIVNDSFLKDSCDSVVHLILLGFQDITHCSVIQTMPLCHSQMSNFLVYPRHETDLALKSLCSVSSNRMMENVQKLRNINSDTSNSHIQV